MNGYLVGPVDLAATDGQSWKDIFITAVKELKYQDTQFTFYDPAAPWRMPDFETRFHSARRSKWIENVNWAVLHGADFVVAHLPKSTASVGSPMELMVAADRGLPILLYTDIPYGSSVYLNNRIEQMFWVTRQPNETAQDWIVRGALLIPALLTPPDLAAAEELAEKLHAELEAE